jgi:hypothetical protein
VAKLVIVDGAAKGYEYRLSSSSLMIGSSREADISLAERDVSKFHARLEHVQCFSQEGREDSP